MMAPSLNWHSAVREILGQQEDVDPSRVAEPWWLGLDSSYWETRNFTVQGSMIPGQYEDKNANPWEHWMPQGPGKDNWNQITLYRYRRSTSTDGTVTTNFQLIRAWVFFYEGSKGNEGKDSPSKHADALIAANQSIIGNIGANAHLDSKLFSEVGNRFWNVWSYLVGDGQKQLNLMYKEIEDGGAAEGDAADALSRALLDMALGMKLLAENIEDTDRKTNWTAQLSDVATAIDVFKQEMKTAWDTFRAYQHYNPNTLVDALLKSMERQADDAWNVVKQNNYAYTAGAYESWSFNLGDVLTEGSPFDLIKKDEWTRLNDTLKREWTKHWKRLDDDSKAATEKLITAYDSLLAALSRGVIKLPHLPPYPGLKPPSEEGPNKPPDLKGNSEVPPPPESGGGGNVPPGGDGGSGVPPPSEFGGSNGELPPTEFGGSGGNTPSADSLLGGGDFGGGPNDSALGGSGPGSGGFGGSSGSDFPGLDGPGLNGAGLDGAGLNGAGFNGPGLNGPGLNGSGSDGPGLGGSGPNIGGFIGAGGPGSGGAGIGSGGSGRSGGAGAGLDDELESGAGAGGGSGTPSPFDPTDVGSGGFKGLPDGLGAGGSGAGGFGTGSSGTGGFGAGSSGTGGSGTGGSGGVDPGGFGSGGDGFGSGSGDNPTGFNLGPLGTPPPGYTPSPLTNFPAAAVAGGASASGGENISGLPGAMANPTPAPGGGMGGMGGMPFMPPMTGSPGGGKDNEQERERSTWLTEDEEVWGTDPDVTAAVIGREDFEPEPGAQPTRRPGQPRKPEPTYEPTRGRGNR